MSTVTEVKASPVAPVVTVPAPVAPVVLQANGVSVKPEATEASNPEAIQAAWLKAQAVWFDSEVTARASAIGANFADYSDFIATADDRKVWKTLGYRSLRMWLFAVLGDTLTTWDSASQKALVRLLTDRGLSGTDVAALTGTSEATVSRAVSGKPKVESTATDRAVKSLESVAGKCGDADKFSTSDLKRLHAELLRTVSLVGDELAKRSGTTLPRSGATGTTATGVNAPKPGAPKGK